MKKLIGTIDTTPKWEDTTMEMLNLIESENRIVKEQAKEVIMDMAKKFDKVIQQTK